MSFASRAREEIAQRSLQKDCCVRAAAYGFACFAKYFDKGGLVLQTEQPHTVQLARELFARCGVQGDVLEKQRPSGVLYEFNIREPEQVARMHELFGTTGSETSLQIDPALIRCQTCVSAYIGAAFLCSGTVTDPQKEYNLEFLTARTNLARDFEALLAEHEFAPHRTRRNGVNLVYVKNSANLERLLRFMGGSRCGRGDPCTESLQAGAQPDQPTDQLRHGQPWQNGPGQRPDPQGHPVSAGKRCIGNTAGGAAAGGSSTAAIPRLIAYRVVRLL